MSKIEQNIGAIVSYFAIVLILLYLTFSTLGLNNEAKFLTAIGIILITTFILCFTVIRTCRKNNKIPEIDYLNIGTQRYILGLFMIFYGLPKILGTFFDYQLFALDNKLIDATEFQLAWYYFGKNKWQELFAGIMELIPGLLLLRRKTYFLGAIILLPVTSQVFILNLFFKIGGVTFPAATILLLCNLYIIYSQKEQILLFVRSLNFKANINFSHNIQTLLKVLKGISIILIALIFYKNIKPVFFKTAEKIQYEKLIGAYTLDKTVQNGIQITPGDSSALYKTLYFEKQSRWNILRRFNDKTDAFIIDIHSKDDSIALYINEGGIGDGKDIIDSTSVLRGVYKLEGPKLIIKGVQSRDTFELTYIKQDKIKPKEWFW